MNAQTNLPIERNEIARICKAREAAIKLKTESAEALRAAYDVGAHADAKRRSATMGNGRSGSDVEREQINAMCAPRSFDVAASVKSYIHDMDRGIWMHLLGATGMKSMMDAEAIEKFNEGLAEEPPEATEDNIRATMETLFLDADMIFLRGLANAFTGLDRRFRSHDGFKIGSRVIFQYAFDSWGHPHYQSKTWDAIADVERVFAVLDGKKPQGSGALKELCRSERKGLDPQQSKTETEYFRLDGFKNGNAHLWFKRKDLMDLVNKKLAEYYGEVLPDAYTGEDDADLFNKSSVPAKDLQFFPTPPEAVKRVLRNINLQEGARVLEPSAGQGGIALEALKLGATVDAVEINPSHCDVLRGHLRRAHAVGCTVKQGNFLSMRPRAIYDFVLMNPPFYGTHYMDHVTHAFKFLKKGGTLVAILPASAEVNDSKKHIAFRKFVRANNHGYARQDFRDLPSESFKESGTRIQTVYIHLHK